MTPLPAAATMPTLRESFVEEAGEARRRAELGDLTLPELARTSCKCFLCGPCRCTLARPPSRSRSRTRSAKDSSFWRSLPVWRTSSVCRRFFRSLPPARRDRDPEHRLDDDVVDGCRSLSRFYGLRPTASAFFPSRRRPALSRREGSIP